MSETALRPKSCSRSPGLLFGNGHGLYLVCELFCIAPLTGIVRKLVYSLKVHYLHNLTLSFRTFLKKNFAEDIATVTGDEEHLYESIPLQVTQTCAKNDLTDEAEEEIDDFESSNEEDNDFPDAQLPAEPIPHYNLTKSLRAAGKLRFQICFSY